jgi:hypothetical protein
MLLPKPTKLQEAWQSQKNGAPFGLGRSCGPGSAFGLSAPYGSLRYLLAGRRLRRKPRGLRLKAGTNLPRYAERA